MMTGTTGEVVIRAMEPEDITAVLSIDRKISGVRRAITYNDLITGGLGGVLDLSFVAEVGGKVAGFILGRHVYVGGTVVEAGLIQTLGVDPAYLHQGIGTKLVNVLLERCQSGGLRTIRTLVNERDSQLQNFFTKAGFRRGRLIEYSKTL